MSTLYIFDVKPYLSQMMFTYYKDASRVTATIKMFCTHARSDRGNVWADVFHCKHGHGVERGPPGYLSTKF